MWAFSGISSTWYFYARNDASRPEGAIRSNSELRRDVSTEKYHVELKSKFACEVKSNIVFLRAQRCEHEKHYAEFGFLAIPLF